MSLVAHAGRHLGTVRLRDGARRLTDQQYQEYQEVLSSCLLSSPTDVELPQT